MICFLDMDGVIADFVGGIHKAHNRPYAYDEPTNLGRWALEDIWGITLDEFWQHDSYEFWRNLELTHDAKEIVAVLESAFGRDNIALLTAPSPTDRGCLTGKRAWVECHFPQFSDRIIYAKAKQYLAHPGAVLIDDKPANVDEFRRFGGQAVLVPRPWNWRASRANAANEIVHWLGELIK